MALNCSVLCFTNVTQTPLDENYNADYMDALSDLFEEQDKVMRDTDPDDWMGYDDETN